MTYFLFLCLCVNNTVEGERGSQTTIQAIEEVTATEQELSSPDTPAKSQKIRSWKPNKKSFTNWRESWSNNTKHSRTETRDSRCRAEEIFPSCTSTGTRKRRNIPAAHSTHTRQGGKDRSKNREKMPTFVIKYTLNYCRFVGIKHLYRIDLLLLWLNDHILDYEWSEIILIFVKSDICCCNWFELCC